MDGIVSLIIAGSMIWLFFTVLKFTLKIAKQLLGRIGPILVSAVPGAITFFLTQALLGHGTEIATPTGIATAAIIGVAGNFIKVDS